MICSNVWGRTSGSILSEGLFAMRCREIIDKNVLYPKDYEVIERADKFFTLALRGFNAQRNPESYMFGGDNGIDEYIRCLEVISRFVKPKPSSYKAVDNILKKLSKSTKTWLSTSKLPNKIFMRKFFVTYQECTIDDGSEFNRCVIR